MSGIRATVAVILAALALPLAGCGKDEPGIPRGDAATLNKLLRAVDRQTAKRGCLSASRTITDLQTQVDTLPPRTDSDVRATLRDGVAELATLVEAECANVKPKPKKPTTTTETQTTEPPTTEPPTTVTTPSPPSTPSTPSVPSTPSTPSTPSNPSGGAPGAKKAKKSKGKSK